MMAMSLYDASVPTFLQTLDAVGGFLAKGLAHCRETGLDPGAIVATRLFPDMHPFRFQVQSVAFHSRGAVEAIRTGALQRAGDRPDHDYAGLQMLIAETAAALRRIPPDEINAREGADVVFRTRDRERVFTAEAFLLSFALPNFHFHATTAYDILRSAGVPLGKLDYMGVPRVKV